jgi:hypothetical protein
MKQLFRKKFSWIFTLAIAMLVVIPFVSFASDVTTAVVDADTPIGSVTLAPGDNAPITISLTITGKQEGTATFTVNKSWILSGGSFTGSTPETFTIGPRAAGDAAQTITRVGSISVAAGQPDGGPFTLAVSAFGITNSNATGAKLSAGTASNYKITVLTPAPSDSTAPVIIPSVAGTLGNNGWYITDVTVSFAVSDPESAVDTMTSACSGVSITADQAATTYTCTATSAGGTNSQSVTIKRDASGPLAAVGVTAGTAGANGWYTSDVTISTSGSDSISGPVSCTADQPQTSETNGTEFNGSCTNQAGLSTDAAPLTVKLDESGPSANLAATGDQGNNGWYIGDVTVSTSGSDSISGPTTCTANQSQTTDTTGTVFNGSCTNNAGLITNADPLTVKRDATAPSDVTGTAARVADYNGWYTSPVNVNFAGVDATSGIGSCTSPSYSGPDDATASVQGNCTDSAGNIGYGSFSLKYDASVPSAALAVTAGTTGANGWYTSNVTVSTSGSDDVSGPVTCTANQSQTTETAGAVFNGSCTNLAGLVGDAAPLTVKLDKTGPSASLAASGTLGNNGWYVSNVTVSTTGSDSISSPTTCTAVQQQTTDTASATFNGSCTNEAGLITSATALTVKRDATAPTLSPSVSPNPVVLNGSATASAGATDNLSGIDTASCGVVNTSSIGSHSVSCTATDNAGNANSASAAYNVIYAWSGFRQPVDNLPALNRVKAGSAIPVKFSLSGYQGLSIFAAGSPSSRVISCSTSAPVDDIETIVTTAGGSSLSYDSSTDQYNYVWKTDKAWGGTCRELKVTLNDGTSHTANFQFTK